MTGRTAPITPGTHLTPFVNGCTKSPGLGLALGQGSAEAVFRYPPEIVLYAINQGDRDHLPVLTQVILGLRDVPFLPGHPELTRHPADDRASVIAQMTARAVQQGDARSRQLPRPVPLVVVPLVVVAGRVPVGRRA